MKTLITAKINPDLDGVACSYAYSHLMKAQSRNVTEGIFGNPHSEAQYLIDRFNINDIAYAPQGPFSNFILVDASDLKGMPAVIRAEDVTEVIDHREARMVDKLFPKARIQIKKVGAAATQIVEKYRDAGLPIDKNSALLLYGAIFSNTLNLKASVTTLRDKKAIEWLEKKKSFSAHFVEDMFMAKTQFADRDIAQTIQNDFKEFCLKNKKIGISQLEVLGLQKLVNDHWTEIINIIDLLKEKYGLDSMLLTAIDLGENFNLFITKDDAIQSLITDIFKIEFKNSIAKKSGMILRKEIVPLILNHLNNTLKNEQKNQF